jgi:hypothetical protein
MSKIHRRPARRHGHHDASLFEWLQASDWRAASPAARRIARRFGIPLHLAAVISRAAGLGEGLR